MHTLRRRNGENRAMNLHPSENTKERILRKRSYRHRGVLINVVLKVKRGNLRFIAETPEQVRNIHIVLGSTDKAEETMRNRLENMEDEIDELKDNIQQAENSFDKIMDEKNTGKRLSDLI